MSTFRSAPSAAGRARVALFLPLLIACSLHAGDVFLGLTRTPLPADQIPAGAQIISKEEIESLGAKNLGDALDRVPTFNRIQNGTLGAQQTVKLRGFFNKQVLVLVDGQPIAQAATGGQDYSQIPVDAVERIEIIRGAASVLYGANAEGGVINLVSKRAGKKGFRGSLSSEYASFNTQTYGAEGGGKIGGLDAWVNGQRRSSNGFRRPNGDAKGYSGSARVGYDFGGAGRTEFLASNNQEETGVPGGTLVPPVAFNGTLEREASDLTTRQFNRNDLIRLEHRLPLWSKGGGLTIRGLQSANAIDYRSLSFPSFTQVRDRTGLVQLDLPFGLTGGYEFRGSRIDSTDYGVHQLDNWAVYFQQQYSPSRFMTLIPAVRYDRNSKYGAFTSPRVTAVWRAGERLKLSSNVSRAFQAPTPADLYNPWAAPDPNLGPEKSWSYDVGAEMTFPSSILGKMTLFRSDIDDRIALDPTQNFAAYNLDKAYSEGMELELQQTLGEFEQSVGYSWMQSEGKTKDGAAQFTTLQYTPRHQGNYLVRYRLPQGVTLQGTVKYVARQYTSNGENGVALPEYVVWGLRLSQKLLGGALEGYLAVDNLLNRRYATSADSINGYYPQPGRTFQGGVKYRFGKET